MNIFVCKPLNKKLLHILRHTWGIFVAFTGFLQLFLNYLKKIPSELNNNNYDKMDQERMNQDVAVDEAVAADGDGEEQPQHNFADNDRFMEVVTDDDDDDNDGEDDNDGLEEICSRSDEHNNSFNSLFTSCDSYFSSERRRKMYELHLQWIRDDYTFKPLKLVKCNYQEKNVRGDFPLARSGHRVIASNSHLYSLGGYNPRSALSAARRGQCLLFQELWSYNFATSRWKLELNADNAKDMPVELASNALAIHNNVLISHGGTGYPFGESCSNDCYVYRPGMNATVSKLVVTGDLPTAQYGPGIVIHKHYLYTIGGTTGYDYSCDVYRLDLRTKVWENMYICRPEMREDPEGRYRHEVVYDGKHIYVLGGGTSHSVYDLQRIPAYNLDANRWDYFDTLPDRVNFGENNGYPKPRKCFSCVQHKLSNGNIEAFITGGLQGDFTTYFSDIWKLNLHTKQWSCITTATLPKPLYFHSAAHSDNGCMYIFGGIEYNNKDMRRRNELYKMWMTIPKLSEMCWDAVLYYNENLDRFSHSKLLKAGIPPQFVERLPPQSRTQPLSLTGGNQRLRFGSLYSEVKRAREQIE